MSADVSATHVMRLSGVKPTGLSAMEAAGSAADRRRSTAAIRQVVRVPETSDRSPEAHDVRAALQAPSCPCRRS
ncbi:MAG: hypothetical protein MZV70_28835 [Desulfobacterales bacterium]|nr:hypothetical protein [Desulfobacterales bacterium]